MNKKQRIEIILDIFQNQESVKVGDIMKRISIDRTTAYRDLQSLVGQWKIEQTAKWIYRLKSDALEYLRTPFFQRPKVSYHFDFLARYRPNETYFFSNEQRALLENAIGGLGIDTDFYHNNRRLLETTLIDLSFASSFLEGNTYDYLDTEILIKYNEIAKEKTLDDTQMILNHKKCIEYMVHYKKDLLYNTRTFCEIHTLLWEKLLPKEHLGIIRNKTVEIGASAYTPLDNAFQLQEQFDLFLDKLNAIKNPFEQSLFILIFIPYFQLFLDINKRTSRMSANLPLLKNHLPLISLLAVDKRTYINAILAIYELNDTSLMADIFVGNYLLNMKRYI